MLLLICSALCSTRWRMIQWKKQCCKMHLFSLQYGRSASHFHKSRKKPPHYSLLISIIPNWGNAILLHISALEKESMCGKDLASWNTSPLKNRAQKQQKKNPYLWNRWILQIRYGEKCIWVEHITLWEVECSCTERYVGFFITSKIQVDCKGPFGFVGCALCFSFSVLSVCHCSWEDNLS